MGNIPHDKRNESAREIRSGLGAVGIPVDHLRVMLLRVLVRVRGEDAGNRMGSHKCQQNVGEKRIREVRSGKLGRNKQHIRGKITWALGDGVFSRGPPIVKNGFPPPTKMKSSSVGRRFRHQTS